MTDRFEQIKKKYEATFSQKHSDLNAAWEIRDFSQLHGLLHKLAGSSGSYGFSDISQLCQQSMKIIGTETVTDQPLLEQHFKKLFSLLQQ